jgi:signal transduction protein with GAF and PtsI domain
LHRRHESARQQTRTLVALERLLTLAENADDARQIADELVHTAADDMQAGRCSLLLRASEPDCLFLAAAKGVPDRIVLGSKVRIGEGIAGRVAATREPLLARDFHEARSHPLREDEGFSSGSFISFPLIFQGAVAGVINFTNRAHGGIYVDDDVERVRLLALPIALVAAHARLAERLAEGVGVA